jgi:phosphatidylserine synthase
VCGTTDTEQPRSVRCDVVDRVLRPVKARVLAPVSTLLAERLGRHGALPITLAGLAVGLAAALAAAFGAFPAALVLWLLNRLVDGLDGEVARHLGRADDRGGYLDLLSDLVVYAAVPLGAAAGATATFGGEVIAASPWTWPLTALLLAAYYVNLGSFAVLAALLEKRGRGAAARGDATSVLIPAGLVEGTETVLLVAAMLAFPAFLPLWLGLGAALVAATAAQRVWWAARTLRGA